MNPFTEKEQVVCISENFPMEITTDEDKSMLGKQAEIHPKKGNTYAINDILGDYLNFSQFNIDGFSWYHYTRFAPIQKTKGQAKTYIYNNA